VSGRTDEARQLEGDLAAAAAQVDRSTQVLKEEPAEDEIVGARIVPLADVGCTKLHIREPLRGLRSSRQRELHLVHVDSDHVSGRTDEARQLEGDLAAAAAQVDAAHPWRNSDSLEEPRGIRPPRTVKDA
jgi:hypothetical protein